MNTLRGADLFVFIPDIPGLPDISAFLVKYYKLCGSFSDDRGILLKGKRRVMPKNAHFFHMKHIYSIKMT